MKIGIISAYEPKGAHFPEEALSFINYMKGRHETHLISPVSYNPIKGVVDTMDVSKSVQSREPLGDFDAIYFGLSGKNIISLGQNHCFSEQLMPIKGLLDQINTYAPNSLVNPLETIYSNSSKQYLLDLDLPFIDTTKITSLDDLKRFNDDSRVYVAKPLVAERSTGTIILDGISEDQLEKYFHEYHTSPQLTGENLLNQKQGIIVQPYQDGFITSGEKKIGVVNGKITLCRVALPSGHGGHEVVSTARGAKMEPYVITDHEREICEHAFAQFNNRYPAAYMRVDLVGDGDVKINELEAINPSYVTRPGLNLHTSDELRFHNESLEEALLSYQRNIN